MTDWLIIVFVMATGFVGLTVALAAILWNAMSGLQLDLAARRPPTYWSCGTQIQQVPIIKPLPKFPVRVRRLR